MQLIDSALPQFAPTTHHYLLDDGRHVLVTVPDDAQPVPEGVAAILGAIKVDHVEPSPTVVFLCDADAVVIDADGDPANGLTALLRCAPGTTHEHALAELAEWEARGVD